MKPHNRRHIIISSRCARTIYVQRRRLALAARDAGWTVTLAGDTVAGDPYPSRLMADGLHFAAVPVQQNSLNPLSLIRLMLAYWALFRHERPQVFHAYTIKPTIAGLIAAVIARVPVRIVTVPGLGHLFLTSSSWKRRIGLLLLRIALRFAHRVDFYNADDMALYRYHRLVTADQSRVALGGSGVDTAHFQPPAHPLPASPCTVLFVGRLLKEKGIAELLQAAELLRTRGVDVKIEIVGDVDSNNPSSLTEAEIRSAVATGTVVWHGAVDDIRPLLSRAHIIVLPSYREGIPMALLEGAAMGRALVTTDVAGCRDVVRQGVTGLIVPPHDAHALANAIASLAQNPAQLADMGQSARADAMERFDVCAVTARTIETYEHLNAVQA